MGIASPNGGSRQQGARRPGRVIPFGKYLLLDRIAVGGMAEVYLAKSFGIEGFEKMLAIKRILPTMAEDEDFIEMFIDEAKIAGQLTHANIVPIFELGKIGESHYIAMEYVWGKDLLQIMNRFRRLRKRMPGPMVAWVATKMCEALDYAHNKRDRRGQPMNIIHRDVSPQNILVSYEGEVKLIDFGIAKAASRTTKTQAGVLKGKFGYMSPEQVRGMPVDLRSDIFAVGTCMYEALTSERLFLGESDFSTLEKVRNASVAPVMDVAEVPSELNEVVMRALQRDPADRYQSASELQEALHKFLARQRPPFGTSKLSAWLKTAFSAEVAKEKAKLDSFANVGRPSVLAGPRRSSVSEDPAVERATQRPPPRAPAPGARSAPPPLPRPGSASSTDELSASDLQPEENLGDLEGEQTMVSSSPFEEGQEPVADGAEGGELNEEPTQIFFSSDDMEEVEEQPAQVPAGGIPARADLVQATFSPGQPPRVGPSGRPPQAPGSRAPAPAPMPPRPAAPLGAGSAGASPPGGAESNPLDPASFGVADAQAASPVATPAALHAPPAFSGTQRNLPTMEMTATDREAAVREAARIANQRRGAGSRTVLLAAVAAVVMLGLGVVGALLVFGGDDGGTLEIRTTPEGATVLIDGLQRGRAPLRVERIKAGERNVEIRAEGFEPITQTVEVQSGGSAMLQIALQRAVAQPPEPVALAQAGSTAAGASPEAEQEPGGSAAEGDDASEDASEEAAASQEDEEESSQPATRARAESAERAEGSTRGDGARARPRPRATSGTLVINTIPWARVFIDGRDSGRNTPVPGIRVRAGTRDVGLRTPDGQMHTFQVTVEAGQTVRLMKRL